jgi:hypothetical protein
MGLRSTKQLTCPACGVVIAEATYQRFPGNLVLVDPDGARLQPEAVRDQLRRAQSAAASAASAGAEPHARDRIAFLEHNLGELVYDLRCRNGHSLLRGMPQLVQAVRDAAGQWVSLA